ncbi:hypothetical protein PUR30_30570 [Streptomyces sp. JV190]|nr:hypothetical protein [Streptomyces sp. JV190]
MARTTAASVARIRRRSSLATPAITLITVLSSATSRPASASCRSWRRTAMIISSERSTTSWLSAQTRTPS